MLFYPNAHLLLFFLWGEQNIRAHNFLEQRQQFRLKLGHDKKNVVMMWRAISVRLREVIPGDECAFECGIFIQGVEKFSKWPTEDDPVRLIGCAAVVFRVPASEHPVLATTDG